MIPADASRSSPYAVILGSEFAMLDPRVQRAHVAPLVARGTLRVEHGTHPLTAVLVRLLKLPPASEAHPTSLTLTSDGPRLLWMRQIGPAILRTEQHARRARIVEVSGYGRIEFAISVEAGALRYRQTAMSAALVRIPPFICPRVDAQVSPAPGGWHVQVSVTWRGHDVCRYEGMMREA